MKSLVELAVFVRVAESKNLSSAARSLSITPSAVSKRLSKLEERLGVTLIHRTTRNVSLSEDGRAFYERCKRILADVTEAEGVVAHGRDEVRGRVRVSVPCTVAREVLAARVGALLELHQKLSLDLVLSEGELDPMRDGVDVALSWGRPTDSALIQRKLATSKVRIYASPAYLARRGVPRSPAALATHDCLASGLERGWTFREGHRVVTVPVVSRLQCDTSDAVKALTMAGLGLSRAPELVMGHFRPNELETVLDDFIAEERPLFARCAPAQPLSARVRVVLDWLVASFSSSRG